jgi:hypothetical protein
MLKQGGVVAEIVFTKGSWEWGVGGMGVTVKRH